MGVIFGCLALFIPAEVTLGFYGLFWVLIGLAMAFFLFLAITARGDESMLWFGLSAALLVVGVISFMVPGFFAVILILALAAIAIINGFTDITLALEHPRTKYLMIPGMIITAIIVLGGLFWLLSQFREVPLLIRCRDLCPGVRPLLHHPRVLYHGRIRTRLNQHADHFFGDYQTMTGPAPLHEPARTCS